MTHDEYVIGGSLRRVVVVKHHGPGPHPGTGTDQSVHGGDGATVAEEPRPAKVGDGAGRGPLGRPTLRHLAKVATYYDTFEEFKSDYQLRNYHGLYWHLTTIPDFVIDPRRAPRDASSMAGGAEGDTPGLMVTTDIGNWVEELGRGGRQYAALIELDDLTPNVDYTDTSRGFGQEIFVNKPEGARVIATYPLERAARMSERHYHGVLPESDEELRAVYEWGHTHLTERGGPGSGFEGHAGRPGKVGGSLPENDWRLHGFSVEEFTKNPNLPMEQMPELGKDMSIVYSNRGNKARWVAQVGVALERFRNATGIAPQGITITDHLLWMLWHGEPYEVLANMQGAEAEEIANVLVRGHFATSAGAYLPQGGPVIYIAPAGRKEEGFPDDTMAHELGHWLTMTAAPAALDAGITPTDRYVHRLIDSYGPGQIQGEYLADLFESLTRRGDRWAAGRFNSELLTATDLENRGILMDTVRHNLVLRTTKEQPGLMVLVLMGDEIVAVPEAELDDLPKGAIINPLYLWWEEHFQPKVELDLDAKAFGWEAEDIAVQGEPEDGIFAVVEEVQRPKGRKETMAEAAGQEEPVSPGETPAPVPEQTPTEPQVKSALDVNVQGGDGDRILPSDVKGLFARFIEMLEKVRVPVVHVDVTPDIHFHAPEQPAPIVNLTLPETNVTVQPTLVVPPAEVTVNVPPHPKHMTERQTVKRSPDKTITEITGEREYWDDEEDTGG